MKHLAPARGFFRPATVLTAVFAACAPFACTGPASFPDNSDVVAAQGVWCDELAKSQGKGNDWAQMGACKGAYPAGSGAYVRRMAKCFFAKLGGAGEEAPVDRSQMLEDCTNQVLVEMTMDDQAASEVTEARCERAERCEKVPFADCREAFRKLDTAQQTMFTVMYNRAALHEVASCMSSKSCSDNEEEARDECYKPVNERVLWFP